MDNQPNLQEQLGFTNYKFIHSTEVIDRYLDQHPEIKNSSILDEQDKDLVADLNLRKENLIKVNESIMNKHLMLTSYKENLCMLSRCYEKIEVPLSEIAPCKKRCTGSTQRLARFMENRVSNAFDQLQLCTQKQEPTQGKFFNMNSMVSCYDLFFNDLEGLEKSLDEEQMYIIP